MSADPTPASRALGAARGFVGLLTALVLGLAVVVVLLDAGRGSVHLAGPAGLAGLIAPVLGHRLYSSRSERASRLETPSERFGAFVTATRLAGIATGGAALFGIGAYAWTGQLPALLGVATHVLLTGAIWPTPERLESFLAPREPTGGEG